jgi:3-oxoacyl-(acyl-carrier-protein) synthase
VGVAVAQNTAEAAGRLQEVLYRLQAPEIVRIVGQVVPLAADQAAELTGRLAAHGLAVDDTTLLGRLNSAAAGFICHRYGFRGPSYALTAACASGLAALYSAVQMLRDGAVDVVVVGGGEEPLTPCHYLEFAALWALAGLSGQPRRPEAASRPLDALRDGLVPGEGGAMVILERESSARRRGARIYGYLAGVGASNNVQGLVESLAASQVQALQASLADAGYGPETIDLVELHATGTLQGDVEEVAALKAVFPQGRPVALAAFKSQIGHTLGSSGLDRKSTRLNSSHRLTSRMPSSA